MVLYVIYTVTVCHAWQNDEQDDNVISELEKRVFVFVSKLFEM